jgi:HEAT repeat protein
MKGIRRIMQPRAVRGIVGRVLRSLLAGLVLAAAPASAAAEGAVPLDRALEAAALERDDVTVRMEEPGFQGGSPLFEQWMTSPLEAPAAGDRLAGRLLSLVSDPPAWPAALPLLEGRNPLETGPVPPSGNGFGIPPAVPPAARGIIIELLEAVSTARAQLEAAFEGVTEEEIRRIERRLFPRETAPRPEEETAWEPEALEETREAIRSAERVNLDGLARAGAILLRAAWEAAGGLSRDEGFLALEKPIRFSTALGEVRIGSAGPDVHQGPALLILDPGGDDVYRGRVAWGGPGGCGLVIDLEGNDAYLGGDRTQGAGVRGAGLLLDLDGDDLYRAGSGAQGAGVFGVGLLVDARGDDRYLGGRFVQAAAAWGWGGLLDLEGNDLYRCESRGQACSWLRGGASLLDACGDDRYVSGLDSPDPREPDMHQSFAQGFAMGMRGLCPGGTALLADGAGNDVYQGGYFAQGASYWMGVGLLHDRTGRDDYLARRYAQGAGIHLSFGMLLDREGDDRTVSWGVSQGCGHDLGVGILVNEAGNDVYAADWLSLGGSEANGIGIFADNRGADGYETRAGAGYGRLVPSRRSGGLGLFLDAGGRDRYSGRGANDRTWFSNRWGVGLDAEAGGESGLSLPPGDGPSPACPDKAERVREEEAARLARILELSEGMVPTGRVEALLAAASHWGHEKGLPDKARKRLLAMDPELSVPVLVERLDRPGVLDWIVTTELFSVHAHTALPRLREKALEGTRRERVRALHALGVLRDTRALEACSTGLADPDPTVRAAAARTVGEMLERGRLETLAALDGALDRAGEATEVDPVAAHLSTEERVAAALSVAARAVSVPWETHERFSGLDPDAGTGDLIPFSAFLLDHREALGEVLGRWIRDIRNPGPAVPRLKRLLEDRTPAVRAAAAYSLGQMEEETALDGISDLLRDGAAPVRDAAALALVFFGDRAVEPVSRFMDPADVGSCVVGLDVLGRIDTPAARAVVSGFLEHPSAVVRMAAETALGLR